MTLKREARRTILLGEVIKGSGMRRRRRIRLGPYGSMLITVLVAAALVDVAALTYAEISYRGGTLAVDGFPVAPQEVENVAIVLTRPAKGSDEYLDSVVAVHMPSAGGRPVAVILPPELRVRLDNGKTGRLIDAYSQGISETVAVVASMTKLEFDAVVRVKLDALSRISAAVGDIEMRAGDRLRVGSADVGGGCTKVEAPAVDDIALTNVDGSSIDRVRNITAIASAAAERASSRLSWLNPVRVVRLAKGVRASVRTTVKGSLMSQHRWAVSLASIGPATVDVRAVPVSEPGARIQGVTYVIANERQTKALFEAMAQGQPLPPFGRSESIAIEPSDINLTVLNGTLTEGLAKRVAKDLSARGFPEAPTTNAPAHESTTVYFRPGNEQKAKLVASRFGVGVTEMTPEIPSGTEVTMVIGQDFVRGEVKLLTEAEATAGARNTKRPVSLQACAS